MEKKESLEESSNTEQTKIEGLKNNFVSNYVENYTKNEFPIDETNLETESTQSIQSLGRFKLSSSIPNDSDLQFEELETVALDIQEETKNVKLPNTPVEQPQQSSVSKAELQLVFGPEIDVSNKSESNVVGKTFGNQIITGSVDNSVNLSDGKITESTCEFQVEDDKSEQPVLTKYFTNIPPETSAMIDPLAEDFFNSVSTNVSPMMKSVSEIAVFQTSKLDDGQTISLEDTNFTIEEDNEITEDLQERDKHSISNGYQSEELPSSRKPSSDQEDKPNLSKFFADEKGGSDPEGKAFFDALAGIGNTGSAFVLASLQPEDSTSVSVTSMNPLVTMTQEEIISDNGDLNNYYDAWIPSKKTQKILEAARKAVPGTFFAEKDQLTMPGIIIEEELEDPIKTLLTEVSPELTKDRVVLTVNSVSQDETGLRQLIAAGCYHAAINLTSILLTNAGQGVGQGGHPSRNTPYTLQILQNLKNGFSEDGSEANMTDTIRKMSIQLWEERERRILYSLVNCVLSLKDYVMAVKLLDLLIQKDESHKPQLLSAFGRLYLQLGDVKAAQECFSQVTIIRSSLPKETWHEVEELVNKAMMAIAQNGYADAYNYYKQAYSLDSNKPMLLNNMAICLLYMGKLKEALALLEKTVQGNTPMCLHDGIIFNICTLYELESSQSFSRKQTMLNLVAKHASDNFNTWCLKIQPSH
ncbi:trafficking protein particle complex subunit 12-like isoform X2 [Centruroides sculpturatus]|uniref:trafficking protein particle complex subunit 12-like isoform X2 n=1 Tax=Centruroides sculpturatus TaxID=218467 RepID=UPI000C6D3B4D|nr:trafficking protein particle complex subunit 12-like isoform X2 [Centruroides sculpturatus]